MDLFADFCNICYKTKDGNLKGIDEENMKHLKDTLITFVGHGDVINQNTLYLCPLCCEELARANKFRDMCFSNLIDLRQRVFNIKCKLELEDGISAVQRALQTYVQEDVLRRNAKSKCTDSIPFEQVEVKSKGIIDCSDVRSESTELVNYQREFNENLDVFDINKSKESGSSTIKHTETEFDVKSEREISISKDLGLRSFENESDERVEVPDVSNREESASSGVEYTKEVLNVKQEVVSALECLELTATENESGNCLNLPFDIVNYGYRYIKTEETAEDDLEFRSRFFNNNSAAALFNTQLIQPCPPSLQSVSRSSSSSRRTLNGDGLYSCTVCHKAFTHISNLTQHERIHSGVKPYECTFCNKKFTQASTLTVHERTHSGVKPHKCTICNKAFTDSSGLIMHARVHNGDKPYKCFICNKSFTQASTLAGHERTHSGVKPYKCSVCNKSFTVSSNLITHERIHNGVKPYKCNVCNKTFTQASTLTAHERIHSIVKSHKCTICNKAFIDAARLINHVRLHSCDRPYKCTICNRTFTQESTLSVHERTHSDSKPF